MPHFDAFWVEPLGTVNLRGWTLQERTNQLDVARVDIAGVDNAGVVRSAPWVISTRRPTYTQLANLTHAGVDSVL